MRRLREAVGAGVRSACRQLLYAAGEEASATSRCRSCLVLSPHADDETLGCGVTIIRKTERGTPVRVLFATDGRRSHAPTLIAPDVLAWRREAEATEACRRLGVAVDRIQHVRLEETRLSDHKAALHAAILAAYREFQPEEMLIPCHIDPHPDHRALNEVAARMLLDGEVACAVYEYPVWFWLEPWHKLWLKRSAGAWFGAPWLSHGLHRSPRATLIATSGYLERKRAALEAHQTQMTRPEGQPAWATLHDVGNGRFLPHFFAPFEVFFRLNLPA